MFDSSVKKIGFFYLFLIMGFLISNQGHTTSRNFTRNHEQLQRMHQEEYLDMLFTMASNMEEEYNQEQRKTAKSIENLMNANLDSSHPAWNEISLQFPHLNQNYTRNLMRNYQSMMNQFFSVYANYSRTTYMHLLSINIYYTLYSLNNSIFQNNFNVQPRYIFDYAPQYSLYYYLMQQAMHIRY